MDQGDGTWRVLGSRPIYENRWITVEMADIVLPSGERQEHHTVTMPTAAMMVVLDDDGEAVLLSWRHRFVPDVWNWELPGGIVDEGETPDQTAMREVIEETGYRPRALANIATFEPMIGMVTSPHHVYVAHGAEKVPSRPSATRDALSGCRSTRFRNSLLRRRQNSGTLVGLLYCLALRSGQDVPEPPALPG